MMLTIWVGLAAALGAVARYLLDIAVQRRHEHAFPFGTLVINVFGSFVLGLFTGLAAHHGLGGPTTAIVGAGLCGGFTTFSTWMWESLALSESGAYAEAAVNVVGSLALGLVAAGAGLGLALL